MKKLTVRVRAMAALLGLAIFMTMTMTACSMNGAAEDPSASQAVSVSEPDPVVSSEPVISEPVHEHDWVEATCTEPKTCAECGETEGVALGHTEGKPATYKYGAICSICGEEFGEPKPLTWVEEGEHSYTTVGENDNSVVITDQKLSVYSQRFVSNETYPEKEGYEYIEVNVTFTFSGEEARQYGPLYYYNYMSFEAMDEDLPIGPITSLYHNGEEVEIEANGYDADGKEDVWEGPEGARFVTGELRDIFQVPVGCDDLVVMFTSAINGLDPETHDWFVEPMPLSGYIDETTFFVHL